MHLQVHRYFGLKGIGNVNKVLSNPLVVADLQNLDNTPREVKNVYVGVISDMIAKAIEGSIKNTSLK